VLLLWSNLLQLAPQLSPLHWCMAWNDVTPILSFATFNRLSPHRLPIGLGVSPTKVLWDIWVLSDSLFYLFYQYQAGSNAMIFGFRKSNQPTAPSGDSHNAPPSNHGGTRHVTIEILGPDKLAFNTRKRHEYEIRAKLANTALVESISSKAKLCVIAVSVV